MKLFLVHPSQSPLADTSSDLIDAIRVAAEQGGEWQVVDNPNAADVVVLHEKFSFKEQRYIRRLLHDPIVGKFAHKILTLNFDDAASGIMAGLYTSLPRSRFEPSLHATIPYFRYHNPLVFTASTATEPTKLAGWRGNDTSHRVRGLLLAKYQDDPRFWLESTSSWYNHGQDEHARFVDMILGSRFSLCPGGLAPTSFRIFESMALGRAPVIISDEFIAPDGVDWTQCSIRIPEGDVPRLGDLLEARASEWRQLGENARKVWDQYFAKERFGAYALQQIGRLHRTCGVRTLAGERARWHSRELWMINGWTLRQRLQRKLDTLIKKPLAVVGAR